MKPRYLYAAVFSWLSFSGGRFTAPFLQKEVGFSESNLGIVLAIQALAICLLSSFGGALADELEKKREHGRVFVMKLGIFLGTFSILLLNVGDTILMKNNIQSRSFSVLFYCAVLRVLYAISIALIMPTIDSITLVHLEREGKDKSYFGKERLFGAFSWAIAHGVMGPMLDLWGYKVIYFTSIAAAIGCLYAFQRYIDDINVGKYKIIHGEKMLLISHYDGERAIDERDETYLIVESGEKSISNSLLSIITAMFGTLFGAGFLVSKFTLSMGTSVVEQLIFLFFEYLGSSNTMCGLTVAVTVMFEIPIFEYAPRMLEKFTIGTIMQIASIAYITRVIGYTIIPKHYPALVLLLEPLHGVTYACSKVSGVEFAAQHSPKGFEASGQGIMTFLSGAGIVLGLLVGGTLEDSFGSRFMYRCLASIVSFGSIFFGLTQLRYRTNK